MEFDWDKIQDEANALHLSEKVGAEIDARYATLLNDFTKAKYPEWQEKLGPTVQDIITSHQDNLKAATEAILIVMLQIIHQLAQHEVLLEYSDRYQCLVTKAVKNSDDSYAKLISILKDKKILSEEDLHAL